jgi:hypothetical protein
MEKNDMQFWFKYTTANTAQKVIQTQKFRWSSPLLFNDPFDHQAGFVSLFTGEELSQKIERLSELAIFGDAPFDPPIRTPFSVSTRLLREVRDRLPKDEVIATIKAASLEIAANFQGIFTHLNEEIRSVLTHSRVFCMTEKEDNVVMWSHYADQHKGAVFKLRRLEKIDHQFIVARKVAYTDEPQPYLTLDQQIDNSVGNAFHDPTPLVWNSAYIKHTDWAYEKEWRVHIPLIHEPAGDGVAFYEEPKELFEAIYLGCRMPRETVDQMTALISEHLPDTEIYQAKKEPSQFRLSFDRIK